VLLLIAVTAAGLISRRAARAQKLEPEQSRSTKQVIVDAHGDEYKRWLNEDVRWIIIPDERQAFQWLSNDQERDEFIRQFWVRRNPNPDSAENKFKEEHYRRLAFANTHFATGEPGWKTDRGHVYIVFGQPDSISYHPAAGNGATKPLEIWHYRSIRVEWPPNRKDQHTLQVEVIKDVVIKDFDFKFVDECDCGQYRIESPWPSDDPDTPASGFDPAHSPTK
jgi:GWxTD domain-containing protein